MNKNKTHWVACIYNASKYLHLGTFETKEEAIAARKGAEKVLGYISR
jgi:hypothetical protein